MLRLFCLLRNLTEPSQTALLKSFIENVFQSWQNKKGLYISSFISGYSSVLGHAVRLCCHPIYFLVFHFSFWPGSLKAAHITVWHVKHLKWWLHSGLIWARRGIHCTFYSLRWVEWQCPTNFPFFVDRADRNTSWQRLTIRIPTEIP